MRALLFVEMGGKKHFKCDTFWSKSQDPTQAKVYSDDSISSLNDWLHPVIHGYIFKDGETIEQSITKWKIWVRSYDDAKLGYFTVKDDLLKNQFCIKDGVQIEDLGNPIYLWQISLKDESNWVINSKNSSVSADLETVREFIDYKQIHRDEAIDDILKEKESE